MTRKTIVCLANSRKLGDFCVAGVDLDSGRWIRPVGSGLGGAVTATEQGLRDGSRPGVLDILEIPLGEPVPEPGQPENWELAEGQWNAAGRLGDREARELLRGMAVDEPIFGTNERAISVADAQAGVVSESLAVVRPENLAWSKEAFRGSVKLRARFGHADAEHDLGVTDLAWIAEFAGDDLGSYPHPDHEEVFLVVSLAEPLNEDQWKLVAGVIRLGSEI